MHIFYICMYNTYMNNISGPEHAHYIYNTCMNNISGPKIFNIYTIVPS